MPVRRTVVIAVLIGCLAAAVAQASLPRATSTLIVPGRSIGGVAMGSSVDKARAAWGPGSTCAITAAGDGTCSYLDDVQASTGRASFTATGNRIVQVFVYAPYDGAARAYKLTGPLTKFHTAKGIHIGSTAAKVRRAYPKAKSGSGYFRIKSGSYVTTIGLVGGKVYSITIGKPSGAGV